MKLKKFIVIVWLIMEEAARARSSDRGVELPGLDFGGEGPFSNVTKFGCQKVGAQVNVSQFGRGG